MRILSLLVLLLSSAATQATMIVIEPDDFSPGTQITSPHANVVFYSEWMATPVFATTVVPGGYAAPTGAAHFGGSAVAFFDREDVPAYGLTFEFFTPVTSVSIWALNHGYDGPDGGLHLDCSVWLAGAATRSMGFCDGASFRTQVGEAYLYTLSFGGLAFDRIVLGGGSSIDAFIFDRLEATAIPEPSTAALLALGVIGLFVGRRLRKAR